MLREKIENYLSDYNGIFAVNIYNFNTKEKIEINSHLIFPSASTIKLLILIELLRKVNIGELDLDTTIKIKDYDIVDGDGILKEINTEVSLKLIDIATLMIIVSDNYATNILIDVLGFENINKTINQLNLNDTKLQRKMMDSEAKSQGLDNLTSSSDMISLLKLLYNNKLISPKFSKLIIDIMLKQQVSGINSLLPEELAIAHKTGDLDFLEHDVGLVFLENSNYAIAILTNELDSNDEGKNLIKNISKLTYEYFKNQE